MLERDLMSNRMIDIYYLLQKSLGYFLEQVLILIVSLIYLMDIIHRSRVLTVIKPTITA
jgi:hypothetical protein